MLLPVVEPGKEIGDEYTLKAGAYLYWLKLSWMSGQMSAKQGRGYWDTYSLLLSHLQHFAALIPCKQLLIASMSLIHFSRVDC